MSVNFPWQPIPISHGSLVSEMSFVNEGQTFSECMQNPGLQLEGKVKLTCSKMCRWEKDEEERRIKEEGKREKSALATWRKLLMGLRIIERVREKYGGDADAHIAEELNPFTNPSKAKKALQAETGTNAALSRDPFAYADDEAEDIGGGFLANDDVPNSGGSLPEGHDAEEGRRRADELTIEDDKCPIEKGSLNGSLSADPDEMSCGLPGTDDSQGALTEADSEDKVAVAGKASTNGKKAAETITSLKGTYSRKRRAAPKRKAVGNSETAFLSHSFEDESDEDDSSNRGMLRSKGVAVNKAVKRKR